MNDTQRMYGAMLALAKGVGRHAGATSSVRDTARSGMEEAFSWWCAEGPYRPGVDKRDDALTTAQQAAEQFGFGDDIIESVSAEMVHSERYRFCRDGRKKRRGSGPKTRSMGTYRFGALSGCAYGHGLKQLPPAP